MWLVAMREIFLSLFVNIDSHPGIVDFHRDFSTQVNRQSHTYGEDFDHYGVLEPMCPSVVISIALMLFESKYIYEYILDYHIL